MFVGLFADNLGSFANNVGRSAFLFANNVVSKLRCLWVEVPMFAGHNIYPIAGEEKLERLIDRLGVVQAKLYYPSKERNTVLLMSFELPWEELEGIKAVPKGGLREFWV